MKLTSAAILGAALLTSAPGTPAPGSGRDGRELVEAAEQAMSEGRFREALDLYDDAGTLWPEKAAIPYNMGVAAYRQGDLARAAELFDQARLLAEDPSLRARSAYNLGTTAARSARSRGTAGLQLASRRHARTAAIIARRHSSTRPF